MSIYNILLSSEYKDFINSKAVNEQQRRILASKIKMLGQVGKNWNCVYELKNTNDLYRLEYSRFRIIFFIGHNNDIVVTNAFIEKNKSDYKKAIQIAHKIKGDYENEI